MGQVLAVGLGLVLDGMVDALSEGDGDMDGDRETVGRPDGDAEFHLPFRWPPAQAPRSPAD